MSALKSRRRGDDPDDEPALAMIRSMFEAADPVPADLVDRIRFSVALAGLECDPDAELARLSVEEAALARGAPEESRTITFDSSSLTIMIRIDSNADGTVRVDGWLAPPQRCRVEITLADGPVVTDADAEGRFAFLSVPRGTARLIVRQAADGTGQNPSEQSGAKAVTTPALMLLLDEWIRRSGVPGKPTAAGCARGMPGSPLTVRDCCGLGSPRSAGLTTATACLSSTNPSPPGC